MVLEIVNNVFSNKNNTDHIIHSIGSDYITFRMSKVVGGYDCEYYVRKFKKLQVNDCDKEFYKMAFGNTIYGDDIDIGKDDYLKATGIIMNDKEFKAFGYYSNDMAVKVKEWEYLQDQVLENPY